MADNEETPEVLESLLDHTEDVLVLLGVKPRTASKLVEEFQERVEAKLPEPEDDDGSDDADDEED